MDKLSRREIIQFGLGIWLVSRKVFAFGDRVTAEISRDRSNFRWFYQEKRKAQEFTPFLDNVFHLYPTYDFQEMIHEATMHSFHDSEIYSEILRRLPEVKPYFQDVTYSWPALRAHKSEMKRQALELLGDQRKINGYLEMGSPGRYLSVLKEDLDISGPIYIFDDPDPGFSPLDIAERGQLSKIGSYVPMGNYNNLETGQVPDESLDLITNFIGFHHCPHDRKRDFILSLKRALRKGGHLLLRDHNVTDENTDILVGLAHDIFNVGLNVPWSDTATQIRNFQSLQDQEIELGALGFKREGPILFQQGDPTLNAGMKFVRVT